MANSRGRGLASGGFSPIAQARSEGRRERRSVENRVAVCKAAGSGKARVIARRRHSTAARPGGGLGYLSKEGTSGRGRRHPVTGMVEESV